MGNSPILTNDLNSVSAWLELESVANLRSTISADDFSHNDHLQQKQPRMFAFIYMFNDFHVSLGVQSVVRNSTAAL